MHQVKLYVAGFSYTNNPAGTGGPEFEAPTCGPASDRVWYQVDRSVLREALWGEDIREAFLDPSDRSTLNDMGVTYGPAREDVERCGMGNYVLWLKE